MASPATALATAAVALALVTALAFGAFGPTDARAADDPAGLRAQADALATRYFGALARAHALDTEIATTEDQIAQLSARVAKLRDVARANALIAYERRSSGIGAIFDAGDVTEMNRRRHLLAGVDAFDRAASRRLQVVVAQLSERRATLDAQRGAEAAALRDLRNQGSLIDAKLAAAQAEQATAAATATGPAPSSSTTPTTPVTGSSTPTTAPAPTTTPPSPTPPPGYVGNPGTNPHHDDPFLTCVRDRESGGNYGAVNPSGPYLGAYQFLQSTWNLAASHGGRADLVGVPANVASPYDQDDVAWALYQWQGAGPWGGSCP